MQGGRQIAWQPLAFLYQYLIPVVLVLVEALVFPRRS